MLEDHIRHDAGNTQRILGVSDWISQLTDQGAGISARSLKPLYLLPRRKYR
jgi:hypothetical protein